METSLPGRVAGGGLFFQKFGFIFNIIEHRASSMD
jgi:hypothetical protein